YIDVFLDESHEHLQAINDNLLSLEKQPENLEIVNEIFRSAHTLKGMAATMEFTDLASLTHQMENEIGRASCRQRLINSVRNGIRDRIVTGVQMCALPI